MTVDSRQLTCALLGPKQFLHCPLVFGEVAFRGCGEVGATGDAVDGGDEHVAVTQTAPVRERGEGERGGGCERGRGGGCERRGERGRGVCVRMRGVRGCVREGGCV